MGGIGILLDVIATGFMFQRQVKNHRRNCRKESMKGTLIFVWNPIMGDEGTLLQWITEQTVAHNEETGRVADIVTN